MTDPMRLCLPQPNTCAPAVFCDELNAGGFESSAKGLNGRHSCITTSLDPFYRRVRYPGNFRQLFCDVEFEIIDPKTGHVVGLVYRWNTGERRKHWHSRSYKIFKLRLIDPMAGQHHEID